MNWKKKNKDKDGTLACRFYILTYIYIIFYTTFLKPAYNNIKTVLRYNGAEMR